MRGCAQGCGDWHGWEGCVSWAGFGAQAEEGEDAARGLVLSLSTRAARGRLRVRSGAVRVPCKASLQTRSGTGPDSATGCPAAAAQAFAGPGEGRGARAVRRGEGSAEGCDSCRRRLGRACKLRQCAYRLLAQDGRVHFAVAAHLPVGLRGDHLGRHRRAPPVAHARVAERVAEQLQPVVAAQEDWSGEVLHVCVRGEVCMCVCILFCFAGGF